jgi:hypothetical protein
MRIKRSFILIIFLAVLLIAVPLFTGCGQVAKYSDPITENILISMNRSDYAGFSRDFDETMKRELPEGSFDAFVDQVNGQIGNYIADSKRMTGVNVKNGLTTATYEADFTAMEDVTVEVVYQEIGGKMKVVGLWFR